MVNNNGHFQVGTVASRYIRLFRLLDLIIQQLFHLWTEGHFIFTIQAEISVCPPCPSLPAPNLYKHGPYHKHLQLSACFVKPKAYRVHYRSLCCKNSILGDNVMCFIMFWSHSSLSFSFREYRHHVPYELSYCILMSSPMEKSEAMKHISILPRNE